MQKVARINVLNVVIAEVKRLSIGDEQAKITIWKHIMTRESNFWELSPLRQGGLNLQICLLMIALAFRKCIVCQLVGHSAQQLL